VRRREPARSGVMPADGHDREQDGIKMIAEVKDPREARSCVGWVDPGAVAPLLVEEVLDPPASRLTRGSTGRDQAEDRPGGLRRGRLALAFERGVVVAQAGFAPASVSLLDRFEPVAGSEGGWVVHREVDGLQPLENLPGPINVVDAPAAVPAAFGSRGDSPGFRASRPPWP
jgi:hypothetical protein